MKLVLKPAGFVIFSTFCSEHWGGQLESDQAPAWLVGALLQQVFPRQQLWQLSGLLASVCLQLLVEL